MPRVPRSSKPRKQPPRPTIVVADDDPPLAQLLEDILSEEGYVVHVVSDGQQALELVRRIQPALLISDVMMPHMNGDDVYEALQSDPTTAAIPVILMSAAATRSNTQQLTFLPKPFQIEQLLSCIQRILNTTSA